MQQSIREKSRKERKSPHLASGHETGLPEGSWIGDEIKVHLRGWNTSFERES